MVDAHLDLAYNARALGRDLTLPLEDLRALDPHPDTPLVTLESLKEAGVAVAFATLFADPREGGRRTGRRRSTPSLPSTRPGRRGALSAS